MKVESGLAINCLGLKIMGEVLMTFSAARLIFGFSLCFGITLSLVACESDEDNKILAAQMCFNELTDSATSTEVDTCLAKINGIESENAYVIRCSGEFLKGGLTTTKLMTAFDGYKAQPKANQEAYLVDQLSLDPLATSADQAYSDCARTGIPGLSYIATLSRLGTKVKHLGGGGSITAAITNCVNDPTLCDNQAIGEMAVSMADLYCKGDAIKQQICIDIASAKAAAGTDLAAVAAALLAQIHP